MHGDGKDGDPAELRKSLRKFIRCIESGTFFVKCSGGRDMLFQREILVFG